MTINSVNTINPSTINKSSVAIAPVKTVNTFSLLLNKADGHNFFIEAAKAMFDDVKKSLAYTEKLTSDSLIKEKGDLVELVTSITETEAKLKILINIRDSVISALQEIMRMQI